MTVVTYADATCIYPGTSVRAVDSLDLEITDGEFMVLVGPSGSGKSTALRMLAGLEAVTSGEVRIDHVDVSGMAPKDRDIAMVFQSYALYPHMSVAENMGFALKLKGVSKADRQAKVLEAAKLLDLVEYLDRRPKALSGGQRQRVAMGRAIVREPRVFLMDEPLSNLDAKLRVETRANVSALQARLGTTTIYVTHDQVEAMTLGHRVAVLDGGRLQQCDTPRNLYDCPANAFVAGFIGSPPMNLRTVELVPDGARLGNVIVPIDLETQAAARRAGLATITLGLRPESFSVAEGSDGLSIEVHLVEELGCDTFVYGALPGDPPNTRHLIVRFDGRHVPRVGERLSLAIHPGRGHAFHPETGERLITGVGKLSEVGAVAGQAMCRVS